MKNLVRMTLAAALGFALVPFAQAQANSATASIHGHVQNPAGQPVTNGIVKLTLDQKSDPKDVKFAYSFPTDANGDYKGTGIAPGSPYLVVVFQQDKSTDFNNQVALKAGEDLKLDFDMTRKEYLDKMSPEDKKALEDYKAKNAAVTSENAKIKDLNATLLAARADNKAGNYDKSVTAMQSAIQQRPNEALLYITLGDGQLGAADQAAAAAKKAGQPISSPDLQQKYKEAAASYQKAIELDAASKKSNPELVGAAYNQIGQALSKSGDPAGAATAYESAAKAQPAQAATYYYNEAATFYNGGKTDEAAAAADKAIALDPKRADLYYIKGQALIGKATVDPKTQKIVAPPGCAEAYQMYLQLDPTGKHAQDVKDVLAGMGETVKSNFKAGKKG